MTKADLLQQEKTAKEREQMILDNIKPLPDISKFNLKTLAKDNSDITDLTKYMLMKFPVFRNESLIPIEWTPHQIRIINAILNRQEKGKRRVHIMASTQYGKSAAVAAGVLLRVIFLPEKWAIVAGTTQQAQIIMRYIIMFATDNPEFAKQLEISKGSSIDRLKRERSKKALTFNNGGRVEVLSAQIKEGIMEETSTRGVTGVMGQGSPNVICDEAALIPDKKFVLIMRMLGGHKDNFLVKIGNPFERNHFLDSYKSREYAKITIDYKIALREGRYTRPYIEEMRKADPELFQILYACEFPPEVDELEGKWQPLMSEEQVRACIEQPTDEINRVGGTKLLGIDLSGTGGDYNVGVLRTRNYARVLFKKRLVKTQFLASYILDYIDEEKINPFNVNIDSQGVGHGLYDILSVRGINGTNVGVRAKDSITFSNLRAELYYRARQWLLGGAKLSAANYRDWLQITKIYIRIRNGKLVVMSKQEARSRGIPSPDAFDALALTFADCVANNDEVANFEEEQRESKPPSAMAV